MGTTAQGSWVRRAEITEMLTEAPHLDNMFLGEKLFPVKTVETESGDYFKMTRAGGGLMRAEGARRDPRGEYVRTERQMTKDGYRTFEYGLEELVDEAEKKRWKTVFDALVNAGNGIRRSLRLLHEIRVKDAIFNPAAWAGGAVAPTADYTTAGLANIDFVKDIEGLMEQFTNYGQLPNTMVLSSYVWRLIRHSPKLQNYVHGPVSSGAGDRQIKVSQIESLFAEDGINVKIHIARIPVDLSKAGSNEVNVSRIWPTSHIFLGNVQSGDYEAGGIGRTLVWDADSPGGLFTSDTYEEPKRRSEVVRVRSHTAEHVIDSTAGILLTTNYA